MFLRTLHVQVSDVLGNDLHLWHVLTSLRLIFDEVCAQYVFEANPTKICARDFNDHVNILVVKTRKMKNRSVLLNLIFFFSVSVMYPWYARIFFQL